MFIIATKLYFRTLIKQDMTPTLFMNASLLSAQSFIPSLSNSLPGAVTADLPGADVVVQREQPVQEHPQPNQCGRQQPTSVET